MEANIIVVDIGNSYIKIAIVNDKLNVLRKLMFKTSERITNRFISKNLMNLSKDINISGAIIGSVVSHITNKFFKTINKMFNVTSFLIDQENVKLSFKFNLPNKKTIGQDLLALSEYCSLKNKNAVGFSFGTAIFGILLIDNEFLGASIAPGIGTSFDEFINRVHMIEVTDLDKKKLTFFGDDTIKALESGVNNIRTGFVDSFYKQAKLKVSNQELACIISGGECHDIVSDFKYIIDENAIIIGFANIFFLNTK